MITTLCRCPLPPTEPRGAEIATELVLVHGTVTDVVADLRALARRWDIGSGRCLVAVDIAGPLTSAGAKAVWRAAGKAERAGVLALFEPEVLSLIERAR